MLSSDKSRVDRYFQLHDSIEESMRRGDYQGIARLAVESIPLFPALVRETKKEYGTFDIVESVAIQIGGRVLMALGRKAELTEMHTVLSSMPETQQWAEEVALIIEDASLADRILLQVEASPGTVQARLKEVLELPDRERLSNICYWLAKVGRLKREKKGNSYALFV
jgi:hypothetical protein